MLRYWISINRDHGIGTGDYARAIAESGPLSGGGTVSTNGFGGAIEALQALDGRDAAGDALLGKSYFMQGQYKEAVANFEKAVGEDSLNSDTYDWLGRAYGRLAKGSSSLSALGYAKKTVRTFSGPPNPVLRTLRR